MVKLSVGSCACTKRGRVYCRKEEGYRFTKRRCPPKYFGKKIPKRR